MVGDEALFQIASKQTGLSIEKDGEGRTVSCVELPAKSGSRKLLLRYFDSVEDGLGSSDNLQVTDRETGEQISLRSDDDE